MSLESNFYNYKHNIDLIKIENVSKTEIMFVNKKMMGNTEIVLHQHDWGQLNIIDSGSIEININNQEKIISPADYAVWIPAGIYHSSYNNENVDYYSLSIPMALAEKLPNRPRIIEVSQISRAIVNDFLFRNINHINTIKDKNLATVLLEQFEDAVDKPSFLPFTNDKNLKPILDYFHLYPENNDSLKSWAEALYVSEKTLARRFQKVIGMTFLEWRSRFRFIKSTEFLKTSLTIHEISNKLGYSNPSSFIIMFKKFTNMTPENYRKQFKK
ncbi:helix-turn-helix transcriptional regulator [Acinetobacter baumannii]|nr:helix-turn-helix transcriptional regulator [Acinetobacter baumannii]